MFMEPLPDKKEFKSALQQGLQRIQLFGFNSIAECILFAGYVIIELQYRVHWLQMHFTRLLQSRRAEKEQKTDDS